MSSSCQQLQTLPSVPSLFRLHSKQSRRLNSRTSSLPSLSKKKSGDTIKIYKDTLSNITTSLNDKASQKKKAPVAYKTIQTNKQCCAAPHQISLGSQSPSGQDSKSHCQKYEGGQIKSSFLKQPIMLNKKHAKGFQNNLKNQKLMKRQSNSIKQGASLNANQDKENRNYFNDFKESKSMFCREDLLREIYRLQNLCLKQDKTIGDLEPSNEKQKQKIEIMQHQIDSQQIEIENLKKENQAFINRQKYDRQQKIDRDDGFAMENQRFKDKIGVLEQQIDGLKQQNSKLTAKNQQLQNVNERPQCDQPRFSVDDFKKAFDVKQQDQNNYQNYREIRTAVTSNYYNDQQDKKKSKFHDLYDSGKKRKLSRNYPNQLKKSQSMNDCRDDKDQSPHFAQDFKYKFSKPYDLQHLSFENPIQVFQSQTKINKTQSKGALNDKQDKSRRNYLHTDMDQEPQNQDKFTQFHVSLNDQINKSKKSLLRNTQCREKSDHQEKQNSLTSVKNNCESNNELLEQSQQDLEDIYKTLITSQVSNTRMSSAQIMNQNNSPMASASVKNQKGVFPNKPLNYSPIRNVTSLEILQLGTKVQDKL